MSHPLRETSSLRTLLFFLYFGGGAIQFVQGKDYYYHPNDERHAPCGFFETVNVTGDTRYENGSYLHNDVLIPGHLIGLYDIVYDNLTFFHTVEPHYRGCICNVRPCISLCCVKCEERAKNFNWPGPELNVTFTDMSTRSTKLFAHFEVQYFRPCVEMFVLFPELNPADDYTIFEDGDMYALEDRKTLNKNHYCMRRLAKNATASDEVMRVLRCFETTEFDILKLIYAFAMVISIPFMMFTIIVYLCIKELRNVHGKSFVCYLTGLVVGYSLLCGLSFVSAYEYDKLISQLLCQIIGYTSYFFFMSSFLWLSVISFDLWHTFRGTSALSCEEKNRFLIYSCYTWTSAAVLLVFTWWAQTYSNFDKKYKPGIAGGEYCWIDIRTWSAMIYFFGPLIVIIVANSVMFAMTAMRIRRVQNETSRVMANGESSQNLSTERDQFTLFLRLFIVMGITWIFDILSYIAGSNYPWEKIFYVSDFFNAIQGFIIFMLFVMKDNVKYLVLKKFAKRSPSIATQSTTTISTNSDNARNADKQAMEMKSRKVVEKNINSN